MFKLGIFIPIKLIFADLSGSH